RGRGTAGGGGGAGHARAVHVPARERAASRAPGRSPCRPRPLVPVEGAPVGRHGSPGGSSAGDRVDAQGGSAPRRAGRATPPAHGLDRGAGQTAPRPSGVRGGAGTLVLLGK